MAHGCYPETRKTEGTPTPRGKFSITTVAVEVDIFSGMPNPAWTLSDAQASVFVAKLSTLIETEAQPRFNHLGYRGLIARIQQGIHEEVRLHGGLVEVRGRISTFFTDPDRALERW